MKPAKDAFNRMRQELRAFRSWWLHELRDLSEACIGRIAPRLATRTLIHVNARGEPNGLDAVPRGSRVWVVLASEDVLSQQLSLPASVERDLEQVISLHLERQLPIARNQVYVEYHVVARRPEEQRVAVQLFIVRRSRINQLRALAQKQGVRLARIALDRGTDGIFGNFLQDDFRASPHSYAVADQRLAACATFLAVGLAAIVMGQWIYERMTVGAELNRVEAIATAVDSLAKQLTSDVAPAEALSQVMATPDAIDVLVALSAELPDDSWAYELEVTAGPAQAPEIKLAGFAPTATTLADAIERSLAFEKVHLESALSAGIGSAQDRFQLKAHWAEPGKAAVATLRSGRDSVSLP